MTDYIIKSILCSGILLLCYHLFLQKEKMFRFNRFYLLFSIVFSLTIPLVTIEIPEHSTPVEIVRYIPTVNQDPVVADTNQLIPKSEHYDWFQNSHIYIYCLVTSFLFLRIGKNLRTVLLKKKNKEIIRFKDYKLVLLTENVVTFTFLNYIFISKEAYQNNLIEKEILVHELAHVKQKHSLDILFTAIAQALFWFNPIIILYKKAIQLNHEFLADEAVLNTKANVKSYQLLLLDKILYTRQVELTSSFNFSITKKRLAMMTRKPKFFNQIINGSLAGVIALSLTIVMSANVARPLTKIEHLIKKPDQQPTKPETKHPSRYKNFGPGLTATEMEEYNAVTGRNTKITKNSKGLNWKNLTATQEEKKRLYTLYTKMNEEQRNKTDFTFFQMPIPVKLAPDENTFQSWKDPAMFGVWINDKKVPNSELSKYKSSDIAEFWTSKLYGGAKKGKKYKYQLDLTTNEAFDKSYNNRVNDRITVGSRTFFKKE